MTVGYRRDYVHRIVWEMHHGPIPTGMMIDHIDGNGLNNKLSNLRLVAVVDNARNARRPKTNKSGVSGVSWSRNGKAWRAYVKADGKQRHIGYFSNLDEARAAVATARRTEGFHENHGR